MVNALAVLAQYIDALSFLWILTRKRKHLSVFMYDIELLWHVVGKDIHTAKINVLKSINTNKLHNLLLTLLSHQTIGRSFTGRWLIGISQTLLCPQHTSYMYCKEMIADFVSLTLRWSNRMKFEDNERFSKYTKTNYKWTVLMAHYFALQKFLQIKKT